MLCCVILLFYYLAFHSVISFYFMFMLVSECLILLDFNVCLCYCASKTNSKYCFYFICYIMLFVPYLHESFSNNTGYNLRCGKLLHRQLWPCFFSFQVQSFLCWGVLGSETQRV